MNNGVANQATRCFRRIVNRFVERARERNPGLEANFVHLQPRNLGEVPSADDFDLVLSSGGPGSPFDGFDDRWCLDYRAFLDAVVERNLRDPSRAPKVFAVCHSFEIAMIHFAVAEMRRRSTRKFGVMPAYLTDSGQAADFLRPFGYRLFSWEHRDWEAVNLDARRLRELGGHLLAEEAHSQSVVNVGDAIVALAFAPGIVGTQFHPEADRPGVEAWLEKPEHRDAVHDAYGELLYKRMVNSLNVPDRLARTFALLIPGWLAHRFNELSETRGWRPMAAPEFDAQEFDVAV